MPDTFGQGTRRTSARHALRQSTLTYSPQITRGTYQPTYFKTLVAHSVAWVLVGNI